MFAKGREGPPVDARGVRRTITPHILQGIAVMLNNVLSSSTSDPELRTAVEAARTAAATASADAAAARLTADQALVSVSGPTLLLWRATALEPSVTATAKSLLPGAVSFDEGIYDAQHSVVFPALINATQPVDLWSTEQTTAIEDGATTLAGLPAVRVHLDYRIWAELQVAQLGSDDGSNGDWVRFAFVATTDNPASATAADRQFTVYVRHDNSNTYTNYKFDVGTGTWVSEQLGGAAPDEFANLSTFERELAPGVWLISVTMQMVNWDPSTIVGLSGTNDAGQTGVSMTISQPMVSVAAALDDLAPVEWWLPPRTGGGGVAVVADLALGKFNAALPFTACASIVPPDLFAGQCPLAVGDGTWQAWVTFEGNGAPRLHVDDGTTTAYADGPTGGLFVVDFPEPGCKWFASLVVEVTATAVSLTVEGKAAATIPLGATGEPKPPAGALTTMVLGARLDRTSSPFAGLIGRAAVGAGYGRAWTAPQDLFTGLLTPTALAALKVRDPRWMYAESA